MSHPSAETDSLSLLMWQLLLALARLLLPLLLVAILPLSWGLLLEALLLAVLLLSGRRWPAVGRPLVKACQERTHRLDTGQHSVQCFTCAP